MTNLMTRKLYETDNCGEALDNRRIMERRRRLAPARGIANGLIALAISLAIYGAAFAAYTYATSGGNW